MKIILRFEDMTHILVNNLKDCQLHHSNTPIIEENHNMTLTHDSSEGEYETCDSGVSERSSLSDDSEAQQVVTSQSERKLRTTGSVTSKRRLSRCLSPNRRQRPRVISQSEIDSQPYGTQSHPRKQVKYHSIISDIFDGKLLSSVQCLTCNRISSRVETFQDLSLPIPSRDHLVVLHGRAATPNAACSDVVVPVQDGWISWILAWLRYWWYGPVVTLHDCLAAFFSTDELKGDNMYSCEKCNKLRNGIKFSKVLQLPEVLCIHLKRFRHELMYSSKILSAVSFPLKGLDMWPYLHVNNTSKVSNYDLFSVICHHGTAGGGHYTCFALNGDQWYEFDDQYVTRVSADRVQNCEAYVLFYRKVQTSAEGVRHKANKMCQETEHKGLDIKKSHISMQWLNRFYYCVEPGPIDNSDFLCQHGAFDPDKELVLDYFSVEIPLEMYDYLYRRFGGCPPVANPVICPACSALQQRIINEMKSFLEVSRRTQAEHWPHTHYLSTTWYLKWHAFVEKKTKEPPGPIDNSKVDPDHIDIDEAAEVPQPIWDFFYSIYGGGPTIFIDMENDGEGTFPPYVSESEAESEENNANEKGDGPTPTKAREPCGLCYVDKDGSTERMEAESNPEKEKNCSCSEITSEVLEECFSKSESTSRKVDGDSEISITNRSSKKLQIYTRGKYGRRNH